MARYVRADIRVGTSIYSDLGRMTIKIEDAFREFIDNSTSSFYMHQSELNSIEIKKCKIQITWNDDEIVIFDNAFGMDIEEFKRALRLNAKPNLNQDNKNIRNEFGWGLKYAAVNLGRWYSIESTALFNKESYYAEIDVDDLERNNTEEIDVRISDVPEIRHGTKITIKRLYKKWSEFNIKSNFVNLIKLISNIYKKDLETKQLELDINREKVVYNPPQFKKNKDGMDVFTHFESSFVFGGVAYPYSGWVAMLETGSNYDAGFSLIKNNRAIKNNYKPKEFFGAGNSFLQQRIVGEIYFDNPVWKVTFTKNGFTWEGTGQETAFLDSLNSIPEVKIIKKFAADFRESNQQLSAKKLIKSDPLSDLKNIQTGKSIVNNGVTSQKKLEKTNNTINVQTHVEPPKVDDVYRCPINFNGMEYIFSITLSDDGEMASKWFKLSKSGVANEYNLVINSRVSQLSKYKKDESKQIIIKIASMVALSQLISKNFGLQLDDSQKFINILNEIMSYVGDNE